MRLVEDESARYGLSLIEVGLNAGCVHGEQSEEPQARENAHK